MQQALVSAVCVSKCVKARAEPAGGREQEKPFHSMIFILLFI